MQTLPLEIFNSDQQNAFAAAIAKQGDLCRAMTFIHEQNETNSFANGAHALEHDLAVAAFAHAIGRRYSESLAETSLVAALMHSYDRHPRLPKGPETYTEQDVRQWIERYLSSMTSENRSAVLEAVLAHDKPNKGKITSTPTTGDILADADKLANIMLYSFIRLGQFASNKPPLRLGNLTARTPGSNYKTYQVVFDDAFSRIEWLDDLSWFVTKEAKLIAPILGDPWRQALKEIDRQFSAIGLDDMPQV